MTDQGQKDLGGKYLQASFRKQAEKEIRLTKSRFDSNMEDSFANMIKGAYFKAKKMMVQLGVYDEDGRLLKGTEKEADEMFKIYHEAYMHQIRTKTNKMQDYMDIIKIDGKRLYD